MILRLFEIPIIFSVNHLSATIHLGRRILILRHFTNTLTHSCVTTFIRNMFATALFQSGLDFGENPTNLPLQTLGGFGF